MSNLLVKKTKAQEGKSLPMATKSTDHDKNPGPFASRAQDLNHYPSLPCGGPRLMSAVPVLVELTTLCRRRVTEPTVIA